MRVEGKTPYKRNLPSNSNRRNNGSTERSVLRIATKCFTLTVVNVAPFIMALHFIEQ